LQLLLVLTGTGLSLVYAGMCVASIVGRRRGSSRHAAYKVRFFPLAPVVGLVSLGYVFYTSAFDPQIGRPSLIINAAIIAISLGYYAFVLRRKGGWALRGPDEESA